MTGVVLRALDARDSLESLTALLHRAYTPPGATGSAFTALDTTAPAAHLRPLYARMGYADVDEVRWEGRTDRTVIMVKPLAKHAPHAGDAEHRFGLDPCARSPA